MRLKLAIAALLVCGVGFVMHERKSALENHLGTVATELGGRHVHVHCQSFAGNLLDVSAEAGKRPLRRLRDPVRHDRSECAPPAPRSKRFPHDVRSADYGCGASEHRLLAENLGGRPRRPTRSRHEVLAPARDRERGADGVLRAAGRRRGRAELFGADPAAAQGDSRLCVHAVLSERAGRVPPGAVRKRRIARLAGRPIRSGRSPPWTCCTAAAVPLRRWRSACNLGVLGRPRSPATGRSEAPGLADRNDRAAALFRPDCELESGSPHAARRLRTD